MMNNSLENLHDIYIPASLGFQWTLGYSLISLFVISVLISSLYFYFSYLLATRFKRTALKELLVLKNKSDIPGIFDLIKRVLLTTNKREEVASLSGENLVSFIKVDEIALRANHSIYNTEVSLTEQELNSFYVSVYKWIKKQEAIYD